MVCTAGSLELETTRAFLPALIRSAAASLILLASLPPETVAFPVAEATALYRAIIAGPDAYGFSGVR